MFDSEYVGWFLEIEPNRYLRGCLIFTDDMPVHFSLSRHFFDCYSKAFIHLLLLLALLYDFNHFFKLA